MPEPKKDRYEITVTERGNSSLSCIHSRPATDDLSKAHDMYDHCYRSLKWSMAGLVVALWDHWDKCVVKYEFT